jgi:small subunit ribosomal protein S16
MSVKIRMRRSGANRDISFRVVATDSRSPRDGNYLEILGWYDPKIEGDNYSIKLDRVEYWIGKGAQMSDTVRSLVRKARRESPPPAATPSPVAAE